MGKSIYTHYRERLIEIGGNNKCLYRPCRAAERGEILASQYAGGAQGRDRVGQAADHP